MLTYTTTLMIAIRATSLSNYQEKLQKLAELLESQQIKILEEAPSHENPEE